MLTTVMNNWKHNKIDFKKDWSAMTSAQGQDILQKVEGLHARTMRTLAAPAADVSYVVTIDNLLKMLSIQLRIKSGLPIIIMGECGCGKSSLIKQLCAIVALPLRILNVHGGLTDDDVKDWILDKIAAIPAGAAKEEETGASGALLVLPRGPPGSTHPSAKCRAAGDLARGPTGGSTGNIAGRRSVGTSSVRHRQRGRQQRKLRGDSSCQSRVLSVSQPHWICM